MTPKEQYEQEKAERKQKRKTQSHVAKTGSAAKKTIIWIIVLAVLAGGIWLLAERSAPSDLEDASQEVPIQGFEHIPDGQTVENYSTNPPTSGPHYAAPAPTGFYTEPVPDERVVHNLEHGHVWVAYHPRISDEAKNVLRDAFGGNAWVIATPRDGNPTDIAVVSWGRFDTFDIEGALDEPEITRIDDYVKRYRNTGRESVPPTHQN